MKEHAVPDPRAVGNYAGAFSRLVAYAVDAALVTSLFSAMVAVFLWLLRLVTARHVEGTDLGTTASSVLFVLWFLGYFGVLWSAAGRTVGMALRVVRRDGSDLGPGKAPVRALTFPLSFVPFGFGFLGHRRGPGATGLPRRLRRHDSRLRLGRPRRAGAAQSPRRKEGRPPLRAPVDHITRPPRKRGPARRRSR